MLGRTLQFVQYRRPPRIPRGCHLAHVTWRSARWLAIFRYSWIQVLKQSPSVISLFLFLAIFFRLFLSLLLFPCYP